MRNQYAPALVLAATWLSPGLVQAEVTKGSGIQNGNVFVRFELANNFVELTPISDSDLINGFGVNTNGLPINEGINESAIAPFVLGWIDPFNGPMPAEAGALPGVGSWLMESFGGCRQLFYTQPSDGFFQGLPGNGNMADLVDGVAGNFLKSVLRDFGRASLVVRYGFENPTDIGRIRVYAGNLNEGSNVGRDGRAFHYYDIYARQGDCMGFSGECPAGPTDQDGFDEFFLVASGVSSGQPGTLTNNPANNPNPWEGTMTDVVSFDANVLIPACTDLRIVIYAVSNTQGFFLDPWQGYVNDDPALQAACEPTYPADAEDQDGFLKAFQAPIIKEIDVFGPIDTPTADVDYDGDIDLFDLAHAQLCFNADVTTNGCYRYDTDLSGAFDATDWATIAPLVSGPQ